MWTFMIQKNRDVDWAGGGGEDDTDDCTDRVAGQIVRCY